MIHSQTLAAKIGKRAFASVFFVFGLLHFGPLEYSLPYVPDFLPFKVFWIYLAGAGQIAFAVSAWTGKLDRLGARALAGMICLFVLMIHIPGVVGAADLASGFPPFIQIFRDAGMAGAALMYAEAFAQDRRLLLDARADKARLETPTNE